MSYNDKLYFILLNFLSQSNLRIFSSMFCSMAKFLMHHWKGFVDDYNCMHFFPNFKYWKSENTVYEQLKDL